MLARLAMRDSSKAVASKTDAATEPRGKLHTKQNPRAERHAIGVTESADASNLRQALGDSDGAANKTANFAKRVKFHLFASSV